MFLNLSPLVRDPLFRAFDDLLGDADTLLRAPRAAATELSRVNGYRTDDAYVLVLEVPGLAKDQLDVKVEDDALHLTGTANIATPEGARTIHRELPDQLRLERRFTFASDADLAHSSAELKDGLLTLHVPRTTPTVRHITVATP
ncbi:MAG: Hsp20/alpha crystallin family protein [Oligoflexia bacterium]|nr:Hsp20/alpha crystallin family protein [Oligoflexia bacterium]